MDRGGRKSPQDLQVGAAIRGRGQEAKAAAKAAAGWLGSAARRGTTLREARPSPRRTGRGREGTVARVDGGEGAGAGRTP